MKLNIFLFCFVVALFLSTANLSLAAGWQCPYNKSSCYNTATDCYAAESSCGTGNNPTPCVQTNCTANVSGGGGPIGPSGGGRGTAVTLPNPLRNTNNIFDVIKNIIGFLQEVAIPIVAGVVIYGAYQMLFAGGDPEKFTTGRRTILYAVIGYAIILIGWGVASILQSILGG